MQTDLARLRKAASDLNADVWPRNLTPMDRYALQNLLTMFVLVAGLLKRYSTLCESTSGLVAEIEKE